MRYAPVFLLPFAWASIAFANELEDCIAQAKYSHDETMCYAEEAGRLDDILEKKQRKMVEGIPGAYAVLVDNPLKIKALQSEAVESHLHWQRYREAFCRFTYDSVIGTGAPAAAVHCRIKLTKHRLEELEADYFP